MPEWHCAACDLSVTDEEGDEPLQAALRKHIGLLTPQQIKAGIKELGITQEKFAERIRCAPESISRWLNGAVLQSRLYDCLMRIYFEFPQVRNALDQFPPGVTFGETVAHARDADVTGCPAA
jgi:DNA-binding transcriptional regulator YiaG